MTEYDIDNPAPGSLRRLKMLLSDEQEPFMLSGREAHLLIEAIATERKELERLGKEIPPEDEMDAQADSESLARLHDVSQRLWVFCGYERKLR